MHLRGIVDQKKLRALTGISGMILLDAHLDNRPFDKLDLGVQKRVITMQSKRTFIAAISAIMPQSPIFLEIMKALYKEMTI